MNEMEENKENEVDNHFDVITMKEAGEVLVMAWLPDLGIEEDDKIFIKQVDNHLEIGKAEVNFIH